MSVCKSESNREGVVSAITARPRCARTTSVWSTIRLPVAFSAGSNGDPSQEGGIPKAAEIASWLALRIPSQTPASFWIFKEDF